MLGSMMLSQEASHVARERLSQDSFYKLAHRDIFQSIIDLVDSRNAVDLILLRDELTKSDKLEKVGGVPYLAQVLDSVPTSANAEHYVEIVREHAVRRVLIEVSAAIQKRSFEDGQAVDELLDEAESKILSVRRMKESGRVSDINEVLQWIVGRLEELHQNPGQLTGLPTGFYDIDQMTNGFQPGELIVLAARPSVGKTSLALNILHHVCAVERRPAVLYSLEMRAEQIVSNLLCIHNRIDTQDFRRGTLKENEWHDIEASIDDLVGLPLHIDDSPMLTILEVRARARRMAQQHGVELIVVDYLQLLTGHRRHENRAVEVGEISQGLKALARELEVPLLAVSQLSRAVEKEQRRPRMSDLRESGAIEQDADVILLLHRPEEGEDEEVGPVGSPAEVILAKQRNGPTGLRRLVFLKRILKFESRASQPDL